MRETKKGSSKKEVNIHKQIEKKLQENIYLSKIIKQKYMLVLTYMKKIMLKYKPRKMVKTYTHEIIPNTPLVKVVIETVKIQALFPYIKS